MAEFNKGDRVRITNYGTAPARTNGLEGTLTGRRWSDVDPEAPESVADWLEVMVDGEFCEWWYTPQYLKAVAVKVQKPKIARPTKVKPKVAKPAKVKPVKVGLASLADAITLYPQTRKVLSHLERRGSISPLEAFGVYRITRLAARIKEIRNAGFKVETIMKTDPTGTKYAEYRLSHA